MTAEAVIQAVGGVDPDAYAAYSRRVPMLAPLIPA
jgi:hypothetical protein